MKLFTEATNLDLTDPANHPNGQLKDATTTTAKDGTRINKTLLADIRTVFTRALKLTGIVPDGNFDTDNSSQLFDVMKKAITEDSGWVEVTDFESGNTTGNDNSFGKLRVRRLNNIVHVTGSYNQNGPGNGFTLPEAFWPDNAVGYRYISGNRSLSIQNWSFEISSIGGCFVPGGLDSGIYYFNASFPIDPTV